MKRFVLIDGHSLLFRAYHALPKTFTNKEGQPINAIYGFMSMLVRVVTDLKPDYLVVAFDEKGPTFRHQDLVTYKEGRPEMDNELQEQQPVVREMLKAFSIPVFSVEGYEGEDVIATIVAKARSSKLEAQNLEFYIVSGDRDVLQLVDEAVKVYSPKKGLSEAIIYDLENVKSVFGVPANQIRDFKGLRGDGSDRIPGVFGIGEKTAVALLDQFGSLENVYRNLDKTGRLLGGKVQEKLMAGAEQAVLSKKIATIVSDAPLTVELSSCRFQSLATNLTGLEFLASLGFKSLIKRLTGSEELIKKKSSRQRVAENQTRLL